MGCLWFFSRSFRECVLSLVFCDQLIKPNWQNSRTSGEFAPRGFLLSNLICEKEVRRLVGRAIWQINSYTKFWRKSMRIWPRRRAKRAVFIAAGNCIVPITIVSRAVVRNGTNASAFVVLKRIAAGANAGVGAFPWAQGLCGHSGRFSYGDDSWPQARTSASHPGALQIDSRTLKRWRQWWLDTFVQSTFWKASPGPVHARVVRTKAALVIVVEI
jgi:hypothetical protein